MHVFETNAHSSKHLLQSSCPKQVRAVCSCVPIVAVFPMEPTSVAGADRDLEWALLEESWVTDPDREPNPSPILLALEEVVRPEVLV